MPNPMFNESTMRKASQTWAPPQPGTDYIPPITDGPVTPWRAGVMTVGGTITATAVLFALLLVTATAGWIAADGPTTVDGQDTYQFPALGVGGHPRRLRVRDLLYFKPHLAKILGPIYAVAQGFFLGAISKGYETFYDGIVVQAAGATIAVFARDARALQDADHQGHRPLPPHRDRRHLRHHGVLRRVLLDPAVRRRRLDQLPLQPEPARHRVQRARGRPGGDEPGARLRLHRSWREAGLVEGLRVVRGVRPAGHRSCGCTSRCCDCWRSCASGDPGARRRQPRQDPPHRRGRDHGHRRCVARRPRRGAVRSVDPTRCHRRDQRRGVRMARHVRLAVAGRRRRVRARLDMGVRHHRRSTAWRTSPPRCAATRSSTTS